MEWLQPLVNSIWTGPQRLLDDLSTPRYQIAPGAHAASRDAYAIIVGLDDDLVVAALVIIADEIRPRSWLYAASKDRLHRRNVASDLCRIGTKSASSYRPNINRGSRQPIIGAHCHPVLLCNILDVCNFTR
jgi:hypothetical protein